ncbi:hypothetical protein BJ912DRAFT_1063513 [Pholiota molesta]|nr:hypothetical protein BJ912DRAFT_1063513 [Pholiota molesta]
MFPKAKNLAFFGGNFTAVHEGLNGLQILSQSPYVVHGAIHDSGQRYPPSECHPGTREDVLDIALRWVDKSLDESTSEIFWLSGPAGVGKTAIAQSLCQRLQELGRLGGDFFLSRSVAGHSDLHTLLPTLAYQLARVYPEFGLDLENVVKSDESILTKNMELQLKQLIVNPLKRASRKSDIPLVLIIDGLDEAGGETDQTLFLKLLQSSLLVHRLPLKIILTSRPEPWIKSVFGGDPFVGSTWCHFLHRTSQTDNDILKVLQFGFANIRTTHDMMKSRSDRWPSSEVIDEIVDRASGQFIYISTLLRYVEDPNGNPAERLSWVVKMPSGGFIDSPSPFPALDNLYKHVLSTSSNLDRTLTILGAIIASFTRTRIPDVPGPIPNISQPFPSSRSSPSSKGRTDETTPTPPPLPRALQPRFPPSNPASRPLVLAHSLSRVGLSALIPFDIPSFAEAEAERCRAN